MVKLALTLTLIFAFGFALGWFFSQSGLVTPTRIDDGSERTSAKTGPGNTDAFEDSAQAYDALARTVSTLPPLEVVADIGGSTGVVRTAAGAALAGVLVEATAVAKSAPLASLRSQVSPSAANDLPPELRDALLQYQWRKGSTRETYTGEDGSYVLEGLIDARYRVAARLDGYEISAQNRVRAEQSRPGDTIDFVANSFGRVLVSVVFKEGDHPPEAQVQWRPATEGGATRHGSTVWYPRHGSIRVAPGTYHWTATYGEFEEFRAADTSLFVEAGDEPVPVELLLEERSGVSGRVLFAEGEELDRAVVYALEIGADEIPDLKVIASRGKSMWADARRSHRYAFLDLAPGQYAFAAGQDRERLSLLETVEIDGNLVKTDLSLPPLEREEYVVLRVSNSEGEALQDVKVGTYSLSKERPASSVRNRPVIAREDASLWVLVEKA